MEQKLTAAEKHYQSHKKSVKKWQAANADKIREQSLAYQQKMKTDRPEAYAAMLAKKKEYYQTVVKARNEKKKQDLQTFYSTTQNDIPTCSSEESEC